MTEASKVRDRHVADHAFGTLVMLSNHRRDAILSDEDAQTCIVGHLRHPELVTRAEAFTCIYTYGSKELDHFLSLIVVICRLFKDSPPETVSVDPHKVMAGAQALRRDQEYEDAMIEGGFPMDGMHRSLVATFVRSSQLFQKAMMDNVRDKDMLKLGRTLYGLLMQSEWGIGDGAFADENGRPLSDLGLPYTMWFESLPHCIKELRLADGHNSEAATCLEIKYAIKHRRFPEAHKVALEYIDKVNSKCAYCYYALAMDSESTKEGLKWSKKVRSQIDL